jgi:hypothetical protein
MESRLAVIERSLVADPENELLLSRLKSQYEQNGLNLSDSISRLIECFAQSPGVLFQVFDFYYRDLKTQLKHVRYFGADQNHPGQPPHIKSLAKLYGPLFREHIRLLQDIQSSKDSLDHCVIMPGFTSESSEERAVPIIAALQNIDAEEALKICHKPIVIALNHVSKAEAEYAADLLKTFQIQALVQNRKRMRRPDQTGMEAEGLI